MPPQVGAQAGAQSPRPPSIQEPLESGWDSAGKLTSSAVIPAADEARAAPPLVPGSPASPARASDAPDPSPPATPTGLPLEVQEQLFGVLRAALDASLEPVLKKQQELESRLASLQPVQGAPASDDRAGSSGSEAKAASPAPPPVVSAPAPAPVVSAPAPPAPGRAALNVSAPVAASAPPPVVATTSLVPIRIDSMAPEASPSMAPKASLVPTSYGFVITPSVPPPRPAMEIALENVGPIDIPDFGRGRRAAGRILVGLLVALLIGAIAATILSYT